MPIPVKEAPEKNASPKKEEPKGSLLDPKQGKGMMDMVNGSSKKSNNPMDLLGGKTNEEKKGEEKGKNQKGDGGGDPTSEKIGPFGFIRKLKEKRKAKIEARKKKKKNQDKTASTNEDPTVVDQPAPDIKTISDDNTTDASGDVQNTSGGDDQTGETNISDIPSEGTTSGTVITTTNVTPPPVVMSEEEIRLKFAEVNKRLSADELTTWIEKSKANGWVPGKDIPDATAVTTYWGKGKYNAKTVDALYVVTHFYPDSIKYTNAIGYSGYWIWENSVSGKTSVLQQHGAIEDYNRSNNTFSPDLIDRVGLAANNEDRKAKALAEGNLGAAFTLLVQSAQDNLFKVKPTMYGFYTPETKTLVDQKFKTAQDQTTMGSTESYHDDRTTLIAKLYYICADLTLYQNAMAEETLNSENAKKDPPVPPKDWAFKSLVASAQDLMFGPLPMYGPMTANPKRTGEMTPETYQAIDNWQKGTKGNEDLMNQRRILTLVSRDYEMYKARREELQPLLQTAQNKAEYDFNHGDQFAYWNPALVKLRDESYSISWEGLMQKYGDLKTQDYTYTHGNTDANVYPLKNPFDKGEIKPYEAALYTTMPTLFEVDPDKRAQNEQFYTNFQSTPQQTVSDKIHDLNFAMMQKRSDLLNDPAFTGNDYLQTYKVLLKTYATAKLDKASPLQVDYVNTVKQKNVAETPIFASSTLNVNQNIQDPDPNYWMIGELQSLTDQVGRKQMAAKSETLSDTFIFYALLYKLLWPYYQNGGESVAGLKKEGGTYNLDELMEIANGLADQKILAAKLPSGNILAHDIQSLQKEKSYLQSWQGEGDMEIVPTYFLPNESDRNQTLASFSSPGHSTMNTASNRSMVTNGIPLHTFLKKTDSGYEMWVNIDREGVVPHSTSSNSNRDEAIAEMFEDIDSDNQFAVGKLQYVISDKSIQTLYTKDNHWQASEVLTWISMALMVAAIPLTAGSSIAALTALASIGTGIAAVVVGVYEKSKYGTVTLMDLGIASLNILASVLPAGKITAGLAKVEKAGNYGFLLGKSFAVTTYAVGATAGLVNGYELTAGFIERYNNLPEDPLARQKALDELLFLSLMNGFLIFHQLTGTPKEMLNFKEQAINPEISETPMNPKDEAALNTEHADPEGTGSTSNGTPKTGENTNADITAEDQPLKSGNKGNEVNDPLAVNKPKTGPEEFTVTRESMKPAELEVVDKFITNPTEQNKAYFLEKPLSTKALRYLSEQKGGIEVAQLYVTDSPKGPGEMYVIFGDKGKIVIPDFPGKGVYLISHIHPSGSINPSAADVTLLKALQEGQSKLGLPEQTSSQILPKGLESTKFTVDTPTEGGGSTTGDPNQVNDPQGPENKNNQDEGNINQKSNNLDENNANQSPLLKGSGPCPGVLEVSPRFKSSEQLKNYYPKEGFIEFIYDSKSKSFLVGKVNGLEGLSPHQKLAYQLNGEILSQDNNSTIVGGMFSRLEDGTIKLSTFSGHFYENYDKIPGIYDEISQFLENATQEKVIWSY